MGRSHTIARAVTTNLTRSATVATLDALAVTILNLFKAGGTYDLGIDRVIVQWDGADFDVILEDDGMSAVASDISARNTTVKNGLESLTPTISAVNTANIETFEQSALAVTADVIIGVDYAADAWDEHWEDPNGAVPTGWTVDTTGNSPDTAVAYVAVGSGYAIELTSDSDGKAMLSKTLTGVFSSNTTWEVRVEIKAADLGTTLAEIPFTIRDGTKQISLRPNSTSLRYSTGAATAAVTVAYGISAGDWITYTVRRLGDYVYIWDGPKLVHIMAYSGLPSDTSLTDQVRLGNSDTGANVATIRRWSHRAGSVNEAPPEYTMRGTTHGR